MRLRQKTLVILTPGFPKSEADTTCMPDRQIFVRVLKQNFPSLNIIVLAFQYPFEAKIERWYGIEVICFNGRNLGKIRRLLTWNKVWNELKVLNRKHELIGILSFWLGECSLIGKLFAKSHSIFHYCWILGQDAKKGNKYVKYVRPKGNELIALSDYLAKEFFQNYSITPANVIPNGIDPTIFAGGDLPRDIDVLGAGSLIPLKRYSVFLNLLREIKSYFPGIRSVIAGKGPEEHNLNQLMADLGLNNNLVFVGEKPHSELLQIMQRSRVFLHTSSYEGFSSVCLEALCAGVQVISFCKPMNREFEHWHFVRNEEEMMEKAVEILKSPSVDHSPYIPYLMNESARRVMELYPMQND